MATIMAIVTMGAALVALLEHAQGLSCNDSYAKVTPVSMPQPPLATICYAH